MALKKPYAAEHTTTEKTTNKSNKKKRKKGNGGGFETFGLRSDLYRAIKRKGYSVPTPIQRKTIPLILSGADVVAMARTGSGKTAAFLIPMLHKLDSHLPSGSVRAVILSPTRDLASQTLKFTRELARFTDLRTCLIVGGDDMKGQFEEMAQNPDIIIATPGRLMHHLNEVEDLSLRSVEYVVFDEADYLFEMGFAQQLHCILSCLSETRQTLLFSATLPSMLADFAKAGLRDPQLVRLNVESKISSDLKLVFLTLRHEEKYAALLYLVREHISSDQQTMIFVSTMHHVEFLNLLFRKEGIECSIGYSKMDPSARKIHVSRFRSRKTMFAIVTDVGARGIDVPSLDNVIIFDFPPKPKMFVHRVGRVARAGRTGTAYSFVTSEDKPYLLDLHLFLSMPVRAAPSECEMLQDTDAVVGKTDETHSTMEAVYGRFPQTVLGLALDKVREIINTNTELRYLEKTCTKAFGQYRKKKPLPSKQSIRRAKDLPCEGLHPMFKDMLGSNELKALALCDQLKSFRPKKTILEAEGEAAKSKHLQDPCGQWVDVMNKKRAIHEKIIEMAHQQQCSDRSMAKELHLEVEFVKKKEKEESHGCKRKAKSFKDEEYFINLLPMHKHTEAGLSVGSNAGLRSDRLDSAVMDLVADDVVDMQKQRTLYHWDKKRKKYMKLNNGERVSSSGKIKTESGNRVTVKKTGIYEKWKRQTHNKVFPARTDGPRNTGANECPAGSFHGRLFPRFNTHHSLPNAHVPPEVKDIEQVHKERQKKKSQVSGSKSKLKKGKKSHKNGKKHQAR